MVTLINACAQIKPLRPELTLDVQQAGSDGYVVTGTTNLPNHPRILVQAIRKLNPNNNDVGKRPASYVIVAQQWVDTQDGHWQATLKLRQPGINGNPVESWQQHPTEAIVASTAEQQVTFVASTSPINPELRLEGDTETATNANRQSEVLHVAVNGSRYLKVQQSLMIPPPQLAKPSALNLERQPITVKALPLPEGGDAKKQEKSDAALGRESYLR